MNKYKKILAVASAGMFAFAQIQTPVLAADEVTKEENVFAILEGDGSVKKVTVSNWLHSEDGFHQYLDESQLENVVNLKGEQQPETKEEGYLWSSDSNDLYYQGTSNKDLPFALTIDYTLDNQEMNLSELMGKSGHLDIKIGVTNQEKQSVNGRELYVPLAVATLVDLDSHHFSDIKVDHGLMKTDDKNQIIASIFFPGLLENYDGILDGYLGDLKNEMVNEMTISCEANDFVIPQIMGGAASSLEELSNMNISDDLNVGDLMSSLNQLQEATDQLLSGTETLKESSELFDEKMGELNKQFTTYQNGIETAYEGMQNLNTGMNALNQAIKTLKQELDQSLLPGLSASSQKQQALQTQMMNLENKLTQLGLNDPDEMTQQLQAALQEAMTNMFKAGLNTGIAATTGGQYQSPEAYLAAIGQENPEQAQLAMAIINSSSEQASLEAKQGIQEILGQLPLNDLASLQEDFVSLSNLASGMMSDLNVLLGKVYDANDDPINPQTLYGSILAVSMGIDQIDNGSQALLSGMGELHQATRTISSAISQFKEGSSAMKDGASALHEGMQTYADEGISQLTDNPALSELQSAVSIQKDMQSIALETYSGSSKGTQSSVRYIFKVDDTVEKKTDDPLENSTKANTKISFWDRFVALFK